MTTMPAPPFTSQFTDEERRLVVDRAHALMRADGQMQQLVAAAQAGREVLKGRTVKGETVIRWAQHIGLPLTRTREAVQEARARGRAHYQSQRREDQRQKLFELVDMEIDRLRALYLNAAPSTADSSLNLASRIQALATTHASLAAQSRSDQLHKLRLEDIDPEQPATDLDDWDGNPEHMPRDVPASILDIDASRRRSAVLRSGS